jgi:uncharacterized repeat protein (TIGR03943 family)
VVVAAVTEDRAAVAAALGTAFIYLALGGGYKDYVRPAMGPYLLVASTILVAVGALGVFRPGGRDPHDIDPSPRPMPSRSVVTILALAPVFVVIGVAPAPLGSYAVALRSRAARVPTRSVFPPLPPREADAVPLSLSDFISRAEYDPGASLRGVRVRLVGRVTPDPESLGSEFWLVRFAIYCCAADAIPLRVFVSGSPVRAPPTDAWVEVTGRWRPAPMRPPGVFDPNVVVVVDADGLRVVDQPEDPYDGTL